MKLILINMEKKIYSTLILLFAGFLTFAQTDYKIGTKHKDGYTSVYTTINKKSTTTYGSTSTENRYGLLDEKTQKIVLPIKYKSAYTSYEDGLYIVQDTLEKYGLFSVKTKEFLVEPSYNKLETFTEGVCIVQKKFFVNGSSQYSYGAIDKTGKLIVPDTFIYLGVCRNGLMSFKQNGKYGYLNKQAKIAIPAMYARAEYFSDGLALAQLTDTSKIGYINTENKFVIEPKYVFAESFYQGYANVFASKKFYSMKNGNVNSDKVGVIDTNGNQIIPPIYESISLKKSGGVFRVSIGEKHGLIDTTGTVILPVENKKVDDFYDGIARVEKTVGLYGLVNIKGKWLLPAVYTEVYALNSKTGYYAKKDGQYSVYDNNMKLIIQADTAKAIKTSKKNIVFVFENSVKIFDISGKLIKTIKQENIDLYGTSFYSNEDSLKVPYFKAIYLYNLQTKTQQKIIADQISDFNEEGIFIAEKSGKYNFYDYTGKKLYNKSFDRVTNFSDGICALQESLYSKPYLADKSLTKIIDLGTIFYGPYSEGLAMAKSQYSNIIYYLDKKGKEQFYVFGTEGTACKNNRIKIKNEAGKFYFVDRNGKKINNSTYDDLGEYYDGLAGFKDNKKAGYIDTSGNIAIAATYDEVSNFTNGTAMVKQENAYFQIDKKGKPINNTKYTSVANPLNGSFPVKKGTNFGLIDSKGNIIADFKYYEIGTISDDMIWARKEKDGNLILLNKNGKEIAAYDFEGCGNFENSYATVLKNKKIGLVDKTGKLVLATDYAMMSKVYKNIIAIVKPNGTITSAVQ